MPHSQERGQDVRPIPQHLYSSGDSGTGLGHNWAAVTNTMNLKKRKEQVNENRRRERKVGSQKVNPRPQLLGWAGGHEPKESSRSARSPLRKCL